MIVAVIILGVLCIGLLAAFVLKGKKPVDDNVTMLLKQDLTTLSENVSKLKDGLQEQIGERLDKNHEMMRESIQKQFSASSKLIGDVTERLTRLDETNKRVVNVADELKTLQNVLQNPKQRGVLGEYYLNQVLENVMPPGRFKLQYKFKDGDLVDAVIILDKGKLLPIDSKFSLENYNRLIEAKDSDTRGTHSNAFKIDLKKRIDETAKYIRPSEGTMDYAFMFIPSEAVYYDLLINKVGATGTNANDLIEYAFRKKNVIIVSPTTFMAYLQTVLQGLRGLEIEEQAKEIQERVGQLGRHLISYEQYMQKLGGSISTTVNHYNNAHRELGKIDKDIVKVSGGEPAVEPLLIERPTIVDEA
jgi:DNA recombination protein RmuC